eukprot:gene1270-1131_t
MGKEQPKTDDLVGAFNQFVASNNSNKNMSQAQLLQQAQQFLKHVNAANANSPQRPPPPLPSQPAPLARAVSDPVYFGTPPDQQIQFQSDCPPPSFESDRYVRDHLGAGQWGEFLPPGLERTVDGYEKFERMGNVPAPPSRPPPMPPPRHSSDYRNSLDATYEQFDRRQRFEEKPQYFPAGLDEFEIDPPRCYPGRSPSTSVGDPMGSPVSCDAHPDWSPPPQRHNNNHDYNDVDSAWRVAGTRNY